MKPTIKLMLAFLLCSINSIIIAQPVNINTAKIIAENQLAYVRKPALKSANTRENIVQFTSIKSEVVNNDTLYYVLNDTINKGFVIVSADMRAWPILAYSTEGNFDEDNQPEALLAWMENRKKEIEHIKKNNIQPNSEIITSWEDLRLKSAAIDTKSVKPLIQTKWGQGCYYNAMCPVDTRSGHCDHVPTGCVATAMSQILKYWNYPTIGESSKSYLDGEYGTISVDFGSTTYQWDQMPMSVTSQNDAVATLMYHCGVAAGMGYGPYGSATNLWPDALTEYFNYSSNAKRINRKDYSTDEWTDVIKSELDLGHPVYYTTKVPTLGGHALVCDGYEGNDFFHFNWGWNGSSDGYYYLECLNPDSQVFDSSQTAIINIIPSHLPDGYNGLILSTNSLAINTKEGISNPINVTVASSSDWTATCNQSWITLSTNSGSVGTSTLKLSTTRNTTNFDREAIVTVTADGFPSQQISIKQYHQYGISAGELSKIMGDNLASITNLSLSGTIDARDFKTMRDLMPALESIDLSEATIISYTGDEGTVIGYKTYPANTVPDQAFSFGTNGENSRLMFFVFPNSTTSIGWAAFNACYNLTNLLLPPSLKSIDEDVFNNCVNLGKLFIPASVLTIGHQIYFDGTSINVDAANPNYLSLDGVLYNKAKTVLIYCQNTKKGVFNIPETVTEIGRNAFMNCMQITSFKIPSSVNTIGSLAFNGCNALPSISLPSSVNVINDAPFFGCIRLTSISVGNPVPVDLKSFDDVFSTVDKDKCTLYVPYNTAALYRDAYLWGDFKNIIEESNGFSLGATEVNLTSPSDTATVSMKGNVSWSAKSNETWLTVSPASGTGDTTLTLIAQNKSSEGERTAKITVSSNGLESQIITVAQYGTAIKVTHGNLAAIFNSEELRTLKTLKLAGNIDARDFKTMRDLMPALESLDLSEVNIIAYIGEEGTALNYGVNNYLANEIPEAAFAFGYFYGKNSLESFILPNTATSIGMYAFCNCKALTFTSLPVMLKSIDSFAFGYCKNLNNIFIPSSVETISSTAFAGSLGPIEVDPFNQSFSSFEGVLYNKNQTTLINCPTFKTESFIIPETVSVIGQWAFEYCSNITSITIPSSVVQIQKLAFDFCTNLTSIVVRNPNPIHLNSSDNVFFLVNTDSCILYVPLGTKEIYQAAEVWKEFKIIIEMPNQPPVASAGVDQIVKGGTTVTLDGTDSGDPEGNYLTYRWAAPNGITLNNTTAANPTFTTPEVDSTKNYSFSLVVNDGELDSQSDEIIVTVNPNKAPVANAGSNQTVNEGDSILLNGSGSYDPDGDKLIYTWMLQNGTVIISCDSAFANFVVPEVQTDTTLTIQLITNDGLLDSQPSLVNIFIKNNENTFVRDFDSYSNLVKVFPNPSEKGDEFTVGINTDVQSLKNGYLTISNLKGQVILQQNKLDSKMKIGHLSNGVYLLQISFPNHQETRKLIVR